MTNVYFMYSDIQISREQKLLSMVGKKFVCGEISDGPQRKKYSKLINTEYNLNSYKILYPDAKIIKIVSSDELPKLQYTSTSKE